MNMKDNLLIQRGKSDLTQVQSDARKVFVSLLLASKNLSLYPEGHSLCVSAVSRCHAQLEEYIRKIGEFRIEIERNRVLCGGHEMHSGPLEEGTLPFTLFRDGIRWLELMEGVTLEEIQQILSIINRYTVLSVEPEGDIVTAFWEAHFPHAQYEVADLLFELSPEQTATVSTFHAVSPQAKSALPDACAPLEDPPIDPGMVELTSLEQDELTKMVEDEEKASAFSHLNMLLDSLLQYEDEGDVGMILAVLSKEFKGSLVRHHYKASLTILEGLRYGLKPGQLKAPGAGRLIEEFFIGISGADSIGPFQEEWTLVSMSEAETLGRMFQCLHPRALDTLAPLLLAHLPDPYEKIFEDAMVVLSRRDPGPLVVLTDHSDDRMVARLVPVLYRVGGPAVVECLMRLTRHSSAPVRRLALKTVFHGRMSPPAQLFQLIDDPDEAVRRIILKQLGRERDPVAEQLLVSYLKSRRFDAGQTDYMTDCFKALGKCGSQQCVAFLKERLMRRKWMPGALVDSERRAAALALAALKIPEARQVIQQAGRSLFPSPRRAARAVMDGSAVKRKGGQ
jgi:HEAT repeat protein